MLAMAKRWFQKVSSRQENIIQVNLGANQQVNLHIEANWPTAFSGDESIKRRQPVVPRSFRRQFSRMASDNEERQQQKTIIKGTTPLHEACCCGDLKCVKILMQKDADVTIWDKRGFTPAHTAVYSNELPCLKVLFDFIPPSLNLANEPSRDGETLLHISCMRGNLDMSQFLLKREANIDSVDCYGNSTLHYAASSDNDVLVRWLISKTKDWEMKINSKNQFGQTACHRACLLGNARSLSVLCQYNADLGLQDSSGCTALDFARIMGHRECFDIGRGIREPHPLPAPPPLHKRSVTDMPRPLNLPAVQEAITGASLGSRMSAKPNSKKANKQQEASHSDFSNEFTTSVPNDDQQLNSRNLGKVFSILLPAATHWYNLGLAVDISVDKLDSIASDNKDNSKTCLREMLKYWLRTSSSRITWSDICQALRSNTVELNRLAEYIEKKYCIAKVKYVYLGEKSSQE